MKRKILIAEDEFLPATHLRAVLAKAGNEIVGAVSTGQECVDLAGETAPDVILLDIRLAGEMDGIEAARRIREFSSATIVFMSGYQERIFRDRAMAAGAAAFLVKPVLLKDIEAILDNPLPSPDTPKPAES